jgi:hypothetical protein
MKRWYNIEEGVVIGALPPVFTPEETRARVRKAILDANAAIYEHIRGPVMICADCALTWYEKDYASSLELHRAICAHEESRLHAVHFKGPGSYKTPWIDLRTGLRASDEVQKRLDGASVEYFEWKAPSTPSWYARAWRWLRELGW